MKLPPMNHQPPTFPAAGQTMIDAIIRPMIRPRPHVIVVKERRNLLEQSAGEKKTRHIRLDDGRLEPADPDAPVIFLDDEKGSPEHSPHLWEICVVVCLQRVRTSVISPTGKVPGVIAGVKVLARLPLDKFEKHCDAMIAGDRVPDFIDWEKVNAEPLE